MSDEQTPRLDPASLHFITRRVSASERAAVAVVLAAQLEQESAQLGAAPGHGTSAWQRSQRPLRTPLVPGLGRWSRPEL
ncbi:acyl-CoA carboxylase epsilon subunit [Microterricola pindariensis]|uniref:acyl-CoA carboxylase epsilon subunit n=1 Tax=Microterricola pindariensis TaxID=478010 RepID=UPI000CEC1942|nr:acyl-CoA carboxylase epsilon subunit [Microterricola pindariensis]